MPNHCENNVSIEGDMYDLLRFWEAMQYDDEIRLANLVPMPDGLNDRDGDWCGWAIENWGTKWGDYEHYNMLFSAEGGYIDMSFMTAWGPFSDAFWHKVSRRFPNLTFVVSYHEPGMVFCGASKYREGETVAQRHIDDYTKVIGEPNWYDEDSVARWLDRLADLRDGLVRAFDR